MPTERLVTLDEFKRHLANSHPERRIDEVIIHHTEEPRASDYRGLSTIQGVRRYHMKVRGWSDNGYNVMFGQPDDIWLCRPLERSGGHCLGHNAHSVGVSFVANYDEQDPRDWGQSTALKAIAAICLRWSLPLTAIHFHREFADKTCPGMKMNLDYFRGQVGAFMGAVQEYELKVILEPGAGVVVCRPVIENNVLRGDVRAVAEALGYEVHAEHLDIGRVYLKRPA
jgi:N-acetylmuramoyl-L-alanine amidase